MASLALPPRVTHLPQLMDGAFPVIHGRHTVLLLRAQPLHAPPPRPSPSLMPVLLGAFDDGGGGCTFAAIDASAHAGEFTNLGNRTWHIDRPFAVSLTDGQVISITPARSRIIFEQDHFLGTLGLLTTRTTK